MDIEGSIEKLKSKQHANLIVNYVLEHRQHLNSLMQLVLCENADIARRAAWVASEYCRLKPHALQPYLKDILRILKSPLHPALSRHLYFCLMQMEIPEKYHGELFSLCINDLSNPHADVAVKANAMSVAESICKNYPVLKDELQLVLEDQLEDAKPAFKARANKILKKITIRKQSGIK